MQHLNKPYGRDTLVNLLSEGDELKKLKEEATTLPTLLLTDRQLCDVEMLLNIVCSFPSARPHMPERDIGGFTPLVGFMNQADYQSVVKQMRLANGTLWPIPINLDVNAETAAKHPVGSNIALVDHETNLIAVMTVESSYVPDKAIEALNVFGSADDECHPAISYLFKRAGSHYLGGPIRGAQLPPHYDFTDLRLTPTQLRTALEKQGWFNVVAFQTRNPMHRSHVELTLNAARDAKANILVHPVVGMTKPGDVDHYTRVRCYKAIMAHYPVGMARLSLLPIAMRMGGPKEAIWHAIIRRNYGATQFIVGRDHAGPGNNKAGKPFYGEYDAQTLILQHEKEIGVKILRYNQVVYVEELGEYLEDNKVPEGHRALNISGTELRRRLFKGIHIPSWFTYPEVVTILRQSYPARKDQGFTVFFTGLSGSGKSTIANALRIALLEDGRRPVSLLDGHELRNNLSSELGFSKEHREINIHRVSYVASTITKSRGIAIVSLIAPYKEARRKAREMISEHGGFVEVYVSTSLADCEKTDRQGLYAKARKGEVANFTGVSDPYEAPEKSEIVINEANINARQAVHEIILYLEQEGYLDA